jgi:hypothetical protein
MYLKTVLKTATGLIFCFGGIVLAYLFLDSLANSANYVFLAGAFVCITGGVFSLVLARKSEALGVKKVKSEPMTPHGQNLIDRNNEMLKDYKQTNETRDRLKMLEAAGDNNVH